MMQHAHSECTTLFDVLTLEYGRLLNLVTLISLRVEKGIAVMHAPIRVSTWTGKSRRPYQL